MVAIVHKNTNLPRILKVCYVYFCMRAKHAIGHFVGFFVRVNFAQDNIGVKTVLATSKNTFEMADNVFGPIEKITSRTIRIGDTLVVKIYFDVIQCLYDTNIYKNMQSRFYRLYYSPSEYDTSLYK
jgi:hypothetical protein